MKNNSFYAKFIAVNIIISIFISFRYFYFLPELPSTWMGWIFLGSATYSQMGLLGGAVAICGLPFLLLKNPWRNIFLSLAATIAIGTLYVDTVVFSQYRFHINSVVIDLLLAGQVIEFPLSLWVFVGCIIAVVCFAQYVLLCFLQKDGIFQRLKIARWVLGGAGIAILLTNGIHVWAAAHAYQPVTQVKRYLPLFYPATSNSTMRKYGWLDEHAVEQQKILTAQKQNSDLNYPIKPLVSKNPEKSLNIVLLVIDSWRAHTFNAENTPNLWNFAQSGMLLQQHYSTGNATRIGIFGMFYGLPGSYWHSVLDNRVSPVLMDRMQELDYQFGIFASAQLENPEFDRTVFSKIKNLRTHSSGASVVERDREITDQWVDWFKHRNKKQPSFSFIFYDAPHGYDFPKDYAHRYEPLLEQPDYLSRNPSTDRLPWINSYKTSVHFVDSLAKNVLEELKSSGEIENTIVIITGDHAEELNENGLNYWGHNSNFSDAQVKVPFAIVGPNITASQAWGDKMTSHADVAPTLMKNFLGVENDVKDYSVGEDLLGQPVDREWLLSSGYSQYAIITKDDIVEIGALGQHQYVDKQYQPLKKSPDLGPVRQALEQMRRFTR